MSAPINQNIAQHKQYELSLSALAKTSRSAAQDFASLTPEALMAYCQSRLRGLDTQIDRLMKTQMGRNKMGEKLSELSNALRAKSDSASGGIEAGDSATKAEVTAAFDAAIAAAGGPETAIGARLQEQKDAFTATANGTDAKNNDGAVADWEVKKFADTVQSIQTDVNRDGELEMIQLQSLMSQRQQALQMCTNMVSSLGQTAMGICQNVGK